MHEIVSSLEKMSHDLKGVNYDFVYDMISKIDRHYAPTAKLHKGHYIDRVRINPSNDEKDFFTNEFEVSYIHDKDVLDKYVGLGRANAPKQAVFYGAVRSPEIPQARVVNYFETTALFKNNPLPDNVSQIFTMSRWEIMDDIEVMEMIFAEKALKESQYARMSFDHQVELLKNCGRPELIEHYLQQAKLFSEQFGRDDVVKGEEYKYTIAAAYANFFWNNSELKGVTYPSVQSIYKGQNVALLPEVVDKHLKLQSVGVFKFERINGMSLPIDSTHIVENLGKDNMDFRYIPYRGVDHLT